jgi:hypothetical protein
VGYPPRVFYVCSASKGVSGAGFVCCANKGVRDCCKRAVVGDEEKRKVELAGADDTANATALYPL